MKSILREQRRSSIVAAAVTILLGLMLVLVPNRSIRFLCGLLGTALMVTGLIYILGWFAKRRDGFPVWFLIPGLLLAALGLWLLSRPASVIVLIQFSFAAVLLFHGVIDLQSALSLMREGWPRWWIDLALAAERQQKCVHKVWVHTTRLDTDLADVLINIPTVELRSGNG